MHPRPPTKQEKAEVFWKLSPTFTKEAIEQAAIAVFDEYTHSSMYQMGVEEYESGYREWSKLLVIIFSFDPHHPRIFLWHNGEEISEFEVGFDWEDEIEEEDEEDEEEPEFFEEGDGFP